MGSLVNSSKHFRKNLYQLSTTFFRGQKQREFLTHSMRQHYYNMKTKDITRKKKYRPTSFMNIDAKIFNQMGFISDMQGWFNIKKKISINVAHHINRLKNYHINRSWKSIWQIPHIFMIKKTPSKIRIEGTSSTWYEYLQKTYIILNVDKLEFSH